MEPSWLSIIPPFIVLTTACITGRLHLSLIIGILSAALIATTAAAFESTKLIGLRLFQYISDKDSIYLGSFLMVIGCLITLICATGGISAFAHLMQKRFSSKRTAESSSLILSTLVGIDDYLNTITVGHVMQPIADRFGIARAKLAYMLHAMSGPLVILVPISSWAAVITNNLDSSGISLEVAKTTKILADPFYVYLKTLPFIFYSIFTLFSVWYIVHWQFSFGPMRTHEKAHQKKQQNNRTELAHSENNALLDIIIPLVTLLGTVMIGIAWTGGYYLFGGNHSLIEAFKNNTQNSLVLFIASLITFALTLLLGLVRKRLSISALPNIIKDGILLMGPSILMLILANTLGNILRYDLLTGDYLAHTFLGSLPITLLPVMFFIIAAITALLTGTSWGTIALLLPIAIPMILSMLALPLPVPLIQISILFPTLGAIFSGAVCGDHLSPISETTIMSATSAGTSPFIHFYTQFPYAIPAFAASTLGFIISGLVISKPLWLNLCVALFAGFVLCIGLFQLLVRYWKRPV